MSYYCAKCYPMELTCHECNDERGNFIFLKNDVVVHWICYAVKSKYTIDDRKTQERKCVKCKIETRDGADYINTEIVEDARRRFE